MPRDGTFTTGCWTFFEQVLELDSSIPWWTLPASASATALLAALFGLTACTRAITVRPIESLRR